MVQNTPEVHNVSQRRHRRTEPRPQTTCTKIGDVRRCGFRVMRADRQTDEQTHSSQYFAPLPRAKQRIEGVESGLKEVGNNCRVSVGSKRESRGQLWPVGSDRGSARSDRGSVGSNRGSAGSDRGAALDPAQHSRVRRRPKPSDDIRQQRGSSERWHPGHLTAG